MIGVVGANGQIGSWLVQWFRARGEPLVVVHRGNLSPRLSRYPVEHRVADMRDRDALAAALEGCDAVVNLAVDKTGYRDRTHQVRANAIETENLVHACEAVDARRLVHVSSIAVLPARVTADTVSQPFRYSRGSDAYTRSKIEAENVVLSARGELEIAMIRPGVVYGPYLWWSMTAVQRSRGATLHLPSDSPSRCYAVHVIDVVRLIHHLVRVSQPAPRLTYAIHPERISWADFYGAHCRAIGAPFQVQFLDSRQLLRHARTDPANLERIVLGSSPAQGLFETRFMSRHMDALYRLRTSTNRIRDSDGKYADRATVPNRSWWPSANDLELHSSSGEFPPEACGRSIGFEYSTALSDGVRGVGLWWNFVVPELSPEERELVDLQLTIT